MLSDGVELKVWLSLLGVNTTVRAPLLMVSVKVAVVVALSSKLVLPDVPTVTMQVPAVLNEIRVPVIEHVAVPPVTA